MSLNRPNNLADALKPLKAQVRDRWAKLGANDFQAEPRSCENEHEAMDEPYGELYLDPDHFFSSWQVRPREVRLHG